MNNRLDINNTENDENGAGHNNDKTRTEHVSVEIEPIDMNHESEYTKTEM